MDDRLSFPDVESGKVVAVSDTSSNLLKESCTDVKCENLSLKNFLVFQEADFLFSPGINVISGKNSSGKTAVLKLLYSLLSGVKNGATDNVTESAKAIEKAFVRKLRGVYMPDQGKIGRLVKSGKENCRVTLTTDSDEKIEFSFGRGAVENASSFSSTVSQAKDGRFVYIPPKEMLSSAGSFSVVSSKYDIGFEDVYRDICTDLLLPLQNEVNDEVMKLVRQLYDQVGGELFQKDGKFYIRMNDRSEIESGLLSEGYRKLSMMARLLMNGTLTKGSILFWDEPETNMNPGMIRPLAEMLRTLGAFGIQIFVTTHDYFLLQYLSMYARHDSNSVQTRFFSLYDTEDTGVQVEAKDRMMDLEHNIIMEEFDNVYMRELELDDDH